MSPAVILLFAIGTDRALADDYNGRFVLGGFFSNERFRDELDGSTSNDFATFSSRMRLELPRLSGTNWQAATDVRDTHDFFDKLNREQLTLTAANRLQLRELVLRLPPVPIAHRAHATFGRFAIPEAGGVFTDGAELGWHWTPELTSTFFGGFNPKPNYLSEMTWNPNSRIFGAYFLYQPDSRSWDSSAYVTHAIVNESVSGETDRTFFYQQISYQPNSASRLLTQLYLDFVPYTYVQNGFLTYSQDLSPRTTGTASVSAIDVIEYTRRQGLRELLAPSPYREGSLQLSLKPSKAIYYTLITDHGKRLADGLWKHEYGLKLNFPQLWDRHWSGYGHFGYRSNFTANEVFTKLGAGYYSDKWELTLDETFAWEKQDSGAILFPITSELALARYLSKALYGTLSFTAAVDSQVVITSGFLKVSYRFGSREIPPVRDGAPPRGEL